MPPAHIALGLLVALLWGANFVVMKHAVSELPPLALTGIRFLLAAIPALFFVPKPAVSWPILLAFGSAFGIVKFGLLFSAFKLGMPAGLASLVLQMQAVFTIVLAYVWLSERPHPLQWASLGGALAGMAVIVSSVEISSVGAGTTVLPVLLTLAAAGAWAVANIAVKRAGHIDMLGFAIWSSLFPGVAMLALALLVEGPAQIGTALAGMTWRGIGAVAYLVYPISILSGALWGFLMSRHSAATVAPFGLLVPVVGMLSGYIVYGETLSATAMIGAALIVSSLLFNGLASRPRRANAG
jgi:O-acetylserine/cysteine efflux transporter